MGSALFHFLSGTSTPIIAENFSGTPTSTPVLKIEWHSFSVPFNELPTLYNTPITKFLNSPFAINLKENIRMTTLYTVC